ncbi:hypothetical protein [Rhizobium giardinii]|uniref:hypothetical protein n=1 Tax=Rhizobium giardinii TaxID=56731 RepID=UPI003D700FA3
MDYATWIFTLLVGATIIGSALAYGVSSNRRCDHDMKLTKQDKMDELAWRKELLSE